MLWKTLNKKAGQHLHHPAFPNKICGVLEPCKGCASSLTSLVEHEEHLACVRRADLRYYRHCNTSVLKPAADSTHLISIGEEQLACPRVFLDLNLRDSHSLLEVIKGHRPDKSQIFHCFFMFLLLTKGRHYAVRSIKGGVLLPAGGECPHSE